MPTPVCIVCKRVLLTDYERELGACAYCDHRADSDPDWFARKKAEHERQATAAK